MLKSHLLLALDEIIILPKGLKAEFTVCKVQRDDEKVLQNNCPVTSQRKIEETLFVETILIE